MRGKAVFLRCGHTAGRITPAYAGKSGTFSAGDHAAQDHPRLCGEKYSQLYQVFHCGGSPPPMRGKDLFRQFLAAVPGITPAYAGKRSSFSPKISVAKDHPRLCGEKFSNCDEKTTCVGSPPPMRGKVVDAVFAIWSTRITPAYAGKSVEICSSSPALRDHPRLCGEKGAAEMMLCGSWGSPPPMRGKAKTLASKRSMRGITPAYAGKRMWRTLYREMQRGSPPPMRGKAPDANPTQILRRITPAYAGKRSSIC